MPTLLHMIYEDLKKKENSQLHYEGALFSEDLFIKDHGTIWSFLAYSLSETVSLPRPAVGQRAPSCLLPPHLPYFQHQAGNLQFKKRTDSHKQRSVAFTCHRRFSDDETWQTDYQSHCLGLELLTSKYGLQPEAWGKWLKRGEVLWTPRLVASARLSPWLTE